MREKVFISYKSEHRDIYQLGDLLTAHSITAWINHTDPDQPKLEDGAIGED